MWFKKKTKKYSEEYVQYSKETAKINPQMIINEYNRIIDDKNQEIKDIQNALNNIKFLYLLI